MTEIGDTFAVANNSVKSNNLKLQQQFQGQSAMEADYTGATMS